MVLHRVPSISGIVDEDTCVHVLALNVPSRTTPKGETTNYGLTVQGKKVLLTDHPSLFKTVDGGLLDVVGSVAFESQEHPGFFLRQKNYKFHVQRKDDTSSFRMCTCFYFVSDEHDDTYICVALILFA